MNRRVVSNLYTKISIVLIILDVSMNVTVAVKTTVTEAVKFVGNVCESNIPFFKTFPIHYLVESLKAMAFQQCFIVVANNQPKMTVETIQQFIPLFVIASDEDISKMVDIVCFTYYTVPIIHHHSVHFIDVCKRSVAELNDVRVEPMRIAYEPFLMHL